MSQCVCCGFPVKPDKVVLFNHKPLHPACLGRWERAWILGATEVRRIQKASKTLTEDIIKLEGGLK